MKNFETLMQAMQENPAEVNSYLKDAARHSANRNLPVLTFSELPWSGDADATTADIIKELKQYGIEEFWVAENSTALNRALIRLMQNDVTITGGEILVVPSRLFSWDEEIPVIKCKIGGNGND